MFIIVAYDIRDNRRRIRVASELENFGKRVQFSVFECHLKKNQIRDLRKRLESLILKSEDKIHYFTLCEKDKNRIIVDGPGRITKEWDFYIA